MNEKIDILLGIFRELPDPRVARTKIHSLEVILFIALCAFLTGGQSFYDMELFARTREEWLKKHIGMISVPSHDTFNRVFQAISAAVFGELLIQMTTRLRKRIAGEVVAIDGKTHRGTKDKESSALHMLNAWAVENRLVLGQLAVEKKSNEITAAPRLLDMLDIESCIITADALNCQKAIVGKIVAKKADYVLAIKGNHPLIYGEISKYMDDIALKIQPFYESVEKNHGRVEIRRYWQSMDIAWFTDKGQWAGLKSFCLVESIREQNGKQEVSRRYYISSLSSEREVEAVKAIRSHWSIENSYHWCLDVVFNEDKSRARTRNAAKNLGILRAICMNLIKKIPGKGSLKGKRYQASLSDEFLFMALAI